ALGCRWFNRQDNPFDPAAAKVFGPGEVPTEKQLVDFVNERAKLVTTLKARNIHIDECFGLSKWSQVWRAHSRNPPIAFPSALRPVQKPWPQPDRTDCLDD